ncbi:hypothetical protein A3A46_01675 [Candidatus Roizmanbacteria bacterium RIFCSPLOWO2_01_FULL_37_13]|uniref:Dihydrodipicolinate synthase family protein n=1 Tax=Candidatus Roizmanbacteria bacterium RIFCSPHIGHO2_02_FULL_38_11 TaxID=1802039 RepID=A0A1F7GZA8_9BACT|nr:MAG: hypothetical protein A3C25_05875 [Candidatus Roizmanbacteria bacterium RIFCSPHIGHO2_02_FULL_38_11]OGK34374.1 MAG: hypothetical protein A3F58_02755 [Candidatus Roizmanbacteria bacterium RIFCSPHIGHO2_12_FULL_37_9b]OGK42575.1 MAG: hypothetical protein A3A46_01675 [Candidatus Roizmanbacteria bacterium RIFCSPLOWO2_01_FULL_37_13]
MKLHGLIVPLITPKFNNDIDILSFRRLIKKMVQAKVEAIFILGTMGEFQYLTLEQKKSLVKEASRVIKRKLPLLVGISSAKLSDSLDLIDFCESYGVDYLVLVSSFNNSDPLKTTYKVSQKTSLPLLLYNNPDIQGGNDLPIKVLRECFKFKKVLGIKNSSKDWKYSKKILKLLVNRFLVFTGREEYFLKSLELGAAGIISSVCNINPKLLKAFYSEKSPKLLSQIVSIKNNIKETYGSTIFGIKKMLYEQKSIRSHNLFKPKL